VTVRIDDEGAVIVRTVVGAKPWGAIILPARRQRRRVEGVNLGAGLGFFSSPDPILCPARSLATASRARIISGTGCRAAPLRNRSGASS